MSWARQQQLLGNVYYRGNWRTPADAAELKAFVQAAAAARASADRDEGARYLAAVIARFPDSPYVAQATELRSELLRRKWAEQKAAEEREAAERRRQAYLAAVAAREEAARETRFVVETTCGDPWERAKSWTRHRYPTQYVSVGDTKVVTYRSVEKPCRKGNRSDVWTPPAAVIRIKF